MSRKLLIWFVSLGLLGLLGFGALAWRPAIAPIAPPPPGSFPPDLVAKGEALAAGGYCAECHTAKGGQKFAGGYAMATPFGVIYSTNITPDPETGIGTWSEAAFARAMHEGVARDGSHLFPAFPLRPFHQSFGRRREGNICLLDDPAAGQGPRAREHDSVPAQYPRVPGRVEDSVLQVRPLRAGCRQERRMESRRLSRAWPEPLRRLPHAAQPARRGKGRQRLCRRGCRQLDRAAVDGCEPCSRAVDAR